MELLQKAKNETSFLKMAFYGEAGSGKTYTSTLVAIGLHKYIKSKKACMFLDTETGSDFMIPIFNEAKIDLFVAKTRAFKDCLSIIDKAEKGWKEKVVDKKGVENEVFFPPCVVLIIDSLTHIWNEMTESYCREHKISRITIQHWPAIKQSWRRLTTKFINSNLHIIMAGRSADKWEDVIDEKGIREVKKVGTKMRSETEIQYEPNLLVELEQIHKSPKIGSGWIHRAWIIKDRGNVQTELEGKHFDNPTFEDFLPHIELLSLGKKHRAIDTDRTSDELFKNKNNGYELHRQHNILLEKIREELYVLFPRQSSEDKASRSNLLKEIFDTRSWTEVEGKKLQELEIGLELLLVKSEKQPEEKSLEEEKKEIKK